MPHTAYRKENHKWHLLCFTQTAMKLNREQMKPLFLRRVSRSTNKSMLKLKCVIPAQLSSKYRSAEIMSVSQQASNTHASQSNKQMSVWQIHTCNIHLQNEYDVFMLQQFSTEYKYTVQYALYVFKLNTIVFTWSQSPAWLIKLSRVEKVFNFVFDITNFQLGSRQEHWIAYCIFE